MIDVEKNRQKLSRLEAHVAWIRQNLGDGPALERRLKEISNIRGEIARHSRPKLPFVVYRDDDK
jgi:hypothetical protein